MTDVRKAIEQIATFIFECDQKIEDYMSRLSDEDIGLLITKCERMGHGGLGERLKIKSEAELAFRRGTVSLASQEEEDDAPRVAAQAR